MRAGKLDKTLLIERVTSTVSDYGTPGESWTTVATVRAQRVQSSTEEFLRTYGEGSESVVIFRIRYRDGLLIADRVTVEGQAFDIKEIKELGRREGLELRCISNG